MRSTHRHTRHNVDLRVYLTYDIMETAEQRDQDIRAVMRPAVHFPFYQLQASNDISDTRVMRVSLFFFY